LEPPRSFASTVGNREMKAVTVVVNSWVVLHWVLSVLKPWVEPEVICEALARGQFPATAQNVPVDVRDAAVTAARAEVGVALARLLWPKSAQLLPLALLQHTLSATEAIRKRQSLTTGSHRHVAAGLEDAVPLLVVHPLHLTPGTGAGVRVDLAILRIVIVVSLRLVSRLPQLLVFWIVCVAVQGAARSLAPRAEHVQVYPLLLLDWVVLLSLACMSEISLAKKSAETTYPNPDVPDPDPDPGPVADLFLTLMMNLACVELRVIPRL
jgi:hypothetical protein